MALIKELPAEYRPRERMKKWGAQSLTDAELLAIMLRTGIKGASAVEIASSLLERFGGLRGLVNAPEEELRKAKGLGEVKRGQIMAGIELSKRMSREALAATPAFESTNAVADYLRLIFANRQTEAFVALWLDNRHHLLLDEILSEGSINEAAVYPREVVIAALKAQASAVIFAHNHPSGRDAEPSPNDISITRRLVAALSLIDIRVLDHMVVSGHRVVSMRANGMDFKGS